MTISSDSQYSFQGKSCSIKTEGQLIEKYLVKTVSTCGNIITVVKESELIIQNKLNEVNYIYQLI